MRTVDFLQLLSAILNTLLVDLRGKLFFPSEVGHMDDTYPLFIGTFITFESN